MCVREGGTESFHRSLACGDLGGVLSFGQWRERLGALGEWRATSGGAGGCGQAGLSTYGDKRKEAGQPRALGQLSAGTLFTWVWDPLSELVWIFSEYL